MPGLRKLPFPALCAIIRNLPAPSSIASFGDLLNVKLVPASNTAVRFAFGFIVCASRIPTSSSQIGVEG